MKTSNGYYEGFITQLQQHQVFVFGANASGAHGLGTAKIAREKYGAVNGVGEGRTGQCYALPTVGELRAPRPSRTLEEIQESVENLYGYATERPELEFLVAYTADNNNLCGYSSNEMAACFVSRRALSEVPDNVIFNKDFLILVEEEDAKALINAV
jgi:hypothetical protein